MRNQTILQKKSRMSVEQFRNSIKIIRDSMDITFVFQFNNSFKRFCKKFQDTL